MVLIFLGTIFANFGQIRKIKKPKNILQDTIHKKQQLHPHPPTPYPPKKNLKKSRSQ